ncbi:MAG: hypothetical protein ABI361_13720 [Nitrososphaera sp.]|jgi:hypothetical protein
MPKLLVQNIISRRLASGGCSRLLLGDGITTQDFSVARIPGLIEGMSVGAKEIKRELPAMGAAISVAKNLDEYDYRICLQVQSMADSPAKLELQKHRIAAVASFSKLVELVITRDQEALVKWSSLAGRLLESASETMLKVTTNPKMNIVPGRIREAMEFFGVPEEEVETSLMAFYGMSR